MNPTENHEVWQVDVGGQIYEASFDEMTQWVFEGSLLPQDMVRRGNLRWIEARKVPALTRFFNAKEKGEPAPVFSNTTNVGPSGNSPAQTFVNTPPAVPTPVVFGAQPAVNAAAAATPPPPAAFTEIPKICSLHDDREASYACETCGSGFCGACPKSFGGTVKICPLCGAMCRSVKELAKTTAAAVQFDTATQQGFGIGDFFTALGYPLRFKSSYFLGGIMFMLFTLGQSAGAMGGLMVGAGALICGMLSNMMTFGVLANVVENFAQGKIGDDFMPRFDDFSIWDDVLHPFFLSIAVYLVSFGLLIAIVVGSIVWGISEMKSNIATLPAADQTRLVTDPNSVIRKNPAFDKQNGLYGDGDVPDEKAIANSQNFDEEKYFEDLNRTINETRKAELESTIGKAPDTVRAERAQMVQSFMGAPALLLLILAGFFWGIFYFPAACCVAGYTRSFVATINPLIGLETIKILGFDYIKIWFMSIALSVIWLVASIIIGIVLLPFEMPLFGNLAANAIGSWIVFYFAISFSVILGLALYKNSHRLKLFRA